MLLWKKRRKSDQGAAITLVSIFLIVLIFFLAMFIVDIGKSIYIQKTLTRYAQIAAETAIKHQNNLGGLSSDAADALRQEYMIRRNPELDPSGTTGTGRMMSRCERNTDYPIISVRFDTGRNRGNSSGASPTYTSYRGEPIDLGQQSFSGEDYNAITAQITDVSDNYFFGLLGLPCQVLKVKATAVAASAYDQEDIELDRPNPGNP